MTRGQRVAATTLALVAAGPGTATMRHLLAEMPGMLAWTLTVARPDSVKTVGDTTYLRGRWTITENGVSVTPDSQRIWWRAISGTTYSRAYPLTTKAAVTTRTSTTKWRGPADAQFCVRAYRGGTTQVWCVTRTLRVGDPKLTVLRIKTLPDGPAQSRPDSTIQMCMAVVMRDSAAYLPNRFASDVNCPIYFYGWVARSPYHAGTAAQSVADTAQVTWKCLPDSEGNPCTITPEGVMKVKVFAP